MAAESRIDAAFLRRVSEAATVASEAREEVDRLLNEALGLAIHLDDRGEADAYLAKRATRIFAGEIRVVPRDDIDF